MDQASSSLSAGAFEADFLQRVIDGIAEPVLVIGLDHRILLLNRAAAATARGDCNPAPLRCHQFSHGHPRPCDEYGEFCPLRAVEESGEAVTATHLHHGPDGRSRIVELLASPYRDADGRLAGIIESTRDITERRDLEYRLRVQGQRLDYLEHHDPLTGLPNRRELIARIEAALENARESVNEIALLYLDVDHFSEITAGFSAAAADEVLRTVGARLRRALGSNDFLAYLGGDDFVVCTARRSQGTHAALLAAKLCATVAAPCELDARTVFLTASVGIGHFPEHASDAETLLSRAAAAAHDASSNGGNQVRAWVEPMSGAARERLVLEAELRDAIGGRQIEVYYQPQVDLASRRITGAEALARWQHPRLGLVVPSRFIPIAERSDLILSIGEQVLRAACARAAEWRAAGLLDGRVAVNLSGRQFREPELTARIAAALAETGCPGDAIELEVTESALIDDSELALPILDALRQLDVSIAIDDFGTGYSSMNRLRQLPVDKLKIDRSFIADVPARVDAQAVATAILGLGRSLRIGIVAEGIETAAQEKFLLAAGCEHGQGFRYGRPLAGADFDAVLQRAPR